MSRSEFLAKAVSCYLDELGTESLASLIDDAIGLTGEIEDPQNDADVVGTHRLSLWMMNGNSLRRNLLG